MPQGAARCGIGRDTVTLAREPLQWQGESAETRLVRRAHRLVPARNPCTASLTVPCTCAVWNYVNLQVPHNLLPGIQPRPAGVEAHDEGTETRLSGFKRRVNAHALGVAYEGDQCELGSELENDQDLNRVWQAEPTVELVKMVDAAFAFWVDDTQFGAKYFQLDVSSSAERVLCSFTRFVSSSAHPAHDIMYIRVMSRPGSCREFCVSVWPCGYPCVRSVYVSVYSVCP